jgi:hypothetical protein
MGRKEFVIEIDVDGTLIDDIGQLFDRKLLRAGTRMSNALREGMYNVIKLVRGSADAKDLDITSGLILDTLAYAKEQIETPHRRVRFRTKNSFSNLDAIVRILELSGIRNPDVNRYDPREEKPDLRVQDDTQEAWKSTWEGVETIHRGDKHSSVLGKISSRIDPRIHFFTNLGDGRASRVTDEIAGRVAQTRNRGSLSFA